MAEVGTAFLTIIPSARGFSGALSGQMSAEADTAGKQAGSRFGSSFKGALGALAVTGAATAFVGFMGDSLKAASDLNETMNKSKVIFGSQSTAMNKWGSGAAKNLGLSKQEALAAASGFGDMFSQIGFGGKASADMSKQVVQMSADLGSFNNLPTSDVAERMSAAFRGEYDSLQALIPNINAARVEQVALATTGKKSTKELTAQEKAAAVLAIVHKDGARAVGDFAKTSDGAANKQKILAAQLEDIKGKFGAALAPAQELAQNGVGKLLDVMAKHPTTVAVMAAAIGTLLVGAFVAWTASIIAANVALLANPITWIIALIVLLVAAVVLIIKHWDDIKAKTGEVWDWIKEKLAAAWGWIKDKAAQAWDAIKSKLADAWDAIKTTIAQKVEDIKTKVGEIKQGILDKLTGAKEWLVDVGKDIITGLGNGIVNSWDWVKGIITDLGGNIVKWAKAALHIGSPSKLMADEVGRWIPAGIAVGIDSHAGDVRSSMAGLTADLTATARLGLRSGRSVTGATDTAATTRELHLKSGALEIVNGKAYITGVISEELLAVTG